MAHPGNDAAIAASRGRQPAGGAAAIWRSDPWIPLLFLASGAAGLIYQVIWTQDLVLIFGETTLAVVTTVTAFLAGLGIGSLVGARIGHRLRRALAVYGYLEIAVGCLALLMPLAFGEIATLFRSAYLSLPPVDVGLIRFGLAFVALMPVTLLMGMSLPVLTRHLVRTNPDVGDRIARLYGLNTLGAVIGSVTSGYALIELLGLRGTTLVAVGFDIFAGLAAVLIARRFPAAGRQQTATRAAAQHKPRLHGRQRLLLGVTFVSGLVSLALEVLWTRMMIQATGSSIYDFVAVVALFLMGIAAGSLVFERHRIRVPQAATLGALLACAAGLSLLPMIVSNGVGPSGLPLAAVLILPVTGILGYTFPLTVRLFVDSADQASRGVGLVYAANTAGCVAGTVLAGFVLIPSIGTSESVIAVCLLLAIAGGALAVRYAPRKEFLRPLAGLLATLVLVLMLFIPAVRLTYVQREIAATGLPTAHFEDSTASVDVNGGTAMQRNLFVNGYGITVLTIDTKVLAYVSKAARPQARTMLNICFGMGSTYRSSIIAGLRTTAVELDPTVPTLMHWFYPDASKYLHSPLGHIIISDGRNYVRLSDARYNLITIDAPPPIDSAGTAVLVSREFYQEASQRLTPGGLMVAFLPKEPPDREKPLLRSFRSAFRYTTVMYGPDPFGTYLLGSSAPIHFSASAILKVFGSPAARADLRSAPDYQPVPASAWPSIIRRSVWLTNNQVNAYTGAGPVITDDHPVSAYFLLQELATGGNSLRSTPVLLSLMVAGLLVWLIIAVAANGMSRRPRESAAASPGAALR